MENKKFLSDFMFMFLHIIVVPISFVYVQIYSLHLYLKRQNRGALVAQLVKHPILILARVMISEL